MSRTVDLDYSDFETLGEIKNKYPDSTLVMRKQFVDIAIQHEWNHGRQVGRQLAVCAKLSPRLKPYSLATAMTAVDRLRDPLVNALKDLIESHSDEMGKLHVRVTFFKEPRLAWTYPQEISHGKE